MNMLWICYVNVMQRLIKLQGQKHVFHATLHMINFQKYPLSYKLASGKYCNLLVKYKLYTFSYQTNNNNNNNNNKNNNN